MQQRVLRNSSLAPPWQRGHFLLHSFCTFSSSSPKAGHHCTLQYGSRMPPHTVPGLTQLFSSSWSARSTAHAPRGNVPCPPMPPCSALLSPTVRRGAFCSHRDSSCGAQSTRQAGRTKTSLARTFGISHTPEPMKWRTEKTHVYKTSAALWSSQRILHTDWNDWSVQETLQFICLHLHSLKYVLTHFSVSIIYFEGNFFFSGRYLTIVFHKICKSMISTAIVLH